MTTEWIELKLPTPSDIGRFGLWISGRLCLSTSLLTVRIWRELSRISVTTAEMSERSLLRLLKVYDAMPLMGMSITETLEAAVVEIADVQPVKDIPSLLNGKHCLILGDTGTGKSTLAQYLAYLVPGKVCVFDADAAPDEWPGLEVIGRAGDYDSIKVAMQTDLIDLQNRIQLRGEKGDAALVGMDTTIICEEFPDVAAVIDLAPEWMLRHARRGRKPKRFLILLSQDDSVKALHIEGEGSVRKNFRYFRLGQFAVEHAKRLKDAQLLAWVKAQSNPCMVDDLPVQLPSYQEMKAVQPRLSGQPVLQPQKTAEPPSESDFQTIETTVEPVSGDADLPLWRSISAHIASGQSESWIIKEILGCTGGKYQQGKEQLTQLKQRYS